MTQKAVTKADIYEAAIQLHGMILDYQKENPKEHGLMNLEAKLRQGVNMDRASGITLHQNGKVVAHERRVGQIVSLAGQRQPEAPVPDVLPDYATMTTEQLRVSFNAVQLRAIAASSGIEGNLNKEQAVKAIYDHFHPTEEVQVIKPEPDLSDLDAE
jgi:hypothetical protein